MKKILLIIVLSFTLIPCCYSQRDSLNYNKKRLNAVYYGREWLGTIHSINYDRILISRGISNIALRVGFSAANKNFNQKGWAYIFPVEYNLLLGKKDHYFESGLSYKLILADFKDRQEDYREVYSFRIGYRIRSQKLGLITRIGVTPTTVFDSFFPLIDGSLGWSF